MIEIEIKIKQIGNGWIVAVTRYTEHSGLIVPLYFATLKEALEYLEKFRFNKK